MTVSLRPPYRQSVTIPANSGTGATLRSLLTLPTREILQVQIMGLLPDGTVRPAIRLASPRAGQAIALADFTTHGEYVAAGNNSPAVGSGDLDSYVRSDSASTVTAIVRID